ncbi:MAG: ATP-dependent 6-phosphofructokinase [Anaerovoracaceae bacterium]|jgi:6-phosphofructokinase 1
MKIGVLTSGGDAPGMNAAIRGIVRCGVEKGMQIYGINRGLQGLIEGDVIEMDARSVADIMQRGGTILRTARSKEFMTPEGQKKALNIIETFGMNALVVIGGDGSLHGGQVLSNAGVTVMGLPGTIDNDLAYTDYTIGFDTAVATCLDGISKLRDTSGSHNRTFVVEVMGRHCGDIALFAGLTGGADAVLVPEVPFDTNEICRKILMGANKGKMHSIIVKAEGADIGTKELGDLIHERTGRDTRVINLSYLQRGGSPTMRDRLLATLCAERAINLIEEGSGSKAIGTVNGKIEAFDLDEALEMKSEFNMDMYDLIGVLSK